jgi:hypothetical protein
MSQQTGHITARNKRCVSAGWRRCIAPRQQDRLHPLLTRDRSTSPNPIPNQRTGCTLQMNTQDLLTASADRPLTSRTTGPPGRHPGLRHDDLQHLVPKHSTLQNSALQKDLHAHLSCWNGNQGRPAQSPGDIPQAWHDQCDCTREMGDSRQLAPAATPDGHGPFRNRGSGLARLTG